MLATPSHRTLPLTLFPILFGTSYRWDKVEPCPMEGKWPCAPVNERRSFKNNVKIYLLNMLCSLFFLASSSPSYKVLKPKNNICADHPDTIPAHSKRKIPPHAQMRIIHHAHESGNSLRFSKAESTNGCRQQKRNYLMGQKFAKRWEIIVG